MSEEKKKAVGQILVEQRSLTASELDKALKDARPGGPPLATRLVQDGVVSEVDALRALSAQRGVPGIELGQICIALGDLSAIPRDIALVHKLLPVLVREDRLFVAMANPMDKKVLEELEFVTGKRAFAYIALDGQLIRAIRDAYDAKDRGESHYVGPSCPPEVIARAGLDPAKYGRARPAAPVQPGAPAPPPPAAGRAAWTDPAANELRMRPSTSSMPAQRRAVVVDSKLEKVVDVEVNEADFGDVAQELSILSELPKAPSKPPPSRSGKKVLVVDDDADIRRLIRKILEERGHRVVEADRGRLALQMVKMEAPDLVILDAMLPEVHGFDIARRIRGSSRYGHIPVIMVSAVYRGWRIAQDAKQSYGVDAFIEKPFKVHELSLIVERSLQSKREDVDPEQISAEAERLLQEGVEAYRAGGVDRAIELLEAGVAIDPLAYRLRFHLGLLYGKRGEVYDGIEQLERAVQIQGQHFPSIKNLAILYQQAGFRNKAVEAWERALTVAPDEGTRAAIKEHIVSLL